MLTPWGCRYVECCRPQWTNHTPNNLQAALKRVLFGQHLAERIVGKSVVRHVTRENPDKALVLSFHGQTGSGKSYVAGIIAKNVYQKGLRSRFVTKYDYILDFPVRNNRKIIEKYQQRIKNDIIEKTKLCGRSLFIFEEVDKMSPGLLDVLQPYLKSRHEVEGIDYRKNIFIFTSNIDAGKINDVAYRYFKEGNSRTDITSKHMEKLLKDFSYNGKGGLSKSELLPAFLVDHFVPFLPMEREHVKQCVRVELARREWPIDEELVIKVAAELQYFPEDLPLFSKSGCKQVAKKIDIF